MPEPVHPTESDPQLGSIEPTGAVAVITGGAGGIGLALGRALRRRGAHVVVADVEAAALDAALVELSQNVEGPGDVTGVSTDVTDEDSVAHLADVVFERYGRCNLLFLNAGVTSGGGGRPWEQEPNDWRWCLGVNVIGLGICISEFVPRMLASGDPGQVVATSSGDGGFAPVPIASVYAASKAAVSCVTESLQHNLIEIDAPVRASVFYPSGGLLPTGLYSAARNRPDHLQRTRGTGRASMTFEQLKERLEASGRDVQVGNLDDLAEFTVDGALERRYVIYRDIEPIVDLLRRRADAISRYEVPPHHNMGV